MNDQPSPAPKKGFFRPRNILIALGVLILLPVVAVVVFLLTLDLNAYRPTIQQKVREATGRDLAIGGPIELSLGLSPALTMSDVSFANAPGGSRPQMVSLRRLELQVAVLPLLGRRVEIKRLVLVEPDILLETDAQGRGNWLMAPESAAPAPAQSEPARPGEAREAGRAMQIGAAEVRIERGRLTYRDGRSGQSHALDLERFVFAAASPDAEATLDGTGRYQQEAFTLKGRFGPLLRLVQPPPAGAAPWPIQLSLEAAGAAFGVQGTIAEPHARRGADLAVTARVADVARLKPFAMGRDLPAVRNIDLRLRLRDPAGAGPMPDIRDLALTVGESDLSAFVSGLRLARLELAASDLASPVTLAVEGALDSEAVKASGQVGAPMALIAGMIGPPARRQGAPPAAWPLRLALEAAGATLNVQGSIAQPATMRGVAVTIAARVPDAARLSRLAGTPLPAVRDIEIAGQLADRANAPGSFELRDLRLKAFDSELTGTAGFSGRAGGRRPRIEADLRSRLVDTAPFLEAMAGRPAGPGQPQGAPTPPPLPAPARAGADGRLFPDTQLFVAGLRGGDANLKLALAELRHGGVAYNDVSLTMALAGGQLSVAPLSLRLPGGQATIRASLDGRTDAPPVALSVRAPGLDLGPLLRAYGVGYTVQGRMDVDVDLRGAGQSVRAIMASLDGHLGLAMGQAVVDNRLIDLIAGNLGRALFPSMQREGNSNVNCFAMRFDSTDGIANARALVFDSNLVAAIGQGQVRLGTEQLAMRVLPTLKVGAGGIAVPVNVGGTLMRPSYQPDAAGVVTGVISGVETFRQQGGVQGLLGGLLGGSQQQQQQQQPQQQAPARPDPCPGALAIARGGRGTAAPQPPASGAAPQTPVAREALPADGAPATRGAPQIGTQQAPAQQQPQQRPRGGGLLDQLQRLPFGR
ncbi:MAG: AsmA family protein [Alphaproteobacteria bacterium]|nr:AsmA family protein [Alphaproteobacteria bacterium]